MPDPVSRDFALVLERLCDASQPLPAADLYHFSGLAGADLEALAAVWPSIAVDRRRGLMHDLAEISDANFEVVFETVFRLALSDDDGAVRAAAIGGLWEVEEPYLVVPFLNFLNHDPDPAVQAAAATALGRYVYLGELDELDADKARRVEEALLDVVQNAGDPAVRRRALEAVAYSSREEVPPLISAAYASDDQKLRASAVFAMGRSADRRWSKAIVAELEHTDPQMRFEAARAAGELELPEAVAGLAPLLDDVDLQVRDAAIWSLGQIGGADARELLTALLENADEDEQDFIQDALDNLEFADDIHEFSLFVLDWDEDGEEDDEARLN